MASLSVNNNNLKISLECPISGEIMKDPVLCSDGHTYERSKIEHWLLDLNKNISPVTGKILKNKILIPNHTVKSMISELNTNNNNKITLEKSVKKELNDLKIKNELEESKKNVSGRTPKDIIYIIDNSGSMGTTEEIEKNQYLSIMQIVQHACKVGIKLSTSLDRIGIITFSNKSSIVMELDYMVEENKNKAIKSIENIKPDSTTNLYAGIYEGLKMLNDRQNKDNLGALFVLTDGLPNIRPPRGEEFMISKFISQNPDFKCILNTYGFGYQLDSKMLFNISSMFDSSFSFISSYDMIGTVFINTISKILLMNKDDLNLKKENNDEIRVIVYKKLYEIIDNLNNYFYNSNGECINSRYIDKENLDKSLKSIYKEIENLISHIKNNYEYNKQDIKGIVQDLEGQVLESISRNDYYIKWGRHYLLSLAQAHNLKICNNFKDPGVQFYSNEIFEKLTEVGGDIFLNMPPPKTKNLNYNYRGGINTSPIIPNNRNINMTSTYNRCGGCILEGSIVSVYKDNKIVKKEIQFLKKNDLILCNGKKVPIICVTKQLCENTKFIRINNNLTITPWHPIKINNEWIFPNDYFNGKEVIFNEPNYMYNIYAGSKSYIKVGDVICATLGHNLNDNKVIQHNYFGTDKIINKLKNLNGWNEGLIELKKEYYIRDNETNKVIAMDIN